MREKPNAAFIRIQDLRAENDALKAEVARLEKDNDQLMATIEAAGIGASS